MKSIRFIVFVLVLAIGGATAWCDGGESSGGAATSVSDLFPHRTDIIRGADFAKDPTLVIPQPTFQAVPKLPKGLSRGTYRLQIAFIIEKDGRVKEAVVMHSSGVPALDQAHIKAVKQWRFRPMEYQGKKVPTGSRQPFTVVL